MDEKQAWEDFVRTGKVTDYIKYARLRDSAAVYGEGAAPSGVYTAVGGSAAGGAAGILPGPSQEVQSAGQNRGTYNQRAGDR